jgi:hypothetical protein
VKALFKLAYYDLQNAHTDLALVKPEFVNKKGICKQKRNLQTKRDQALE